ncbi:hypothetical protein LOK49_LG13G02276 [Camellia lanceoleosa]|uniref:Uncharacterized protein n=1 Tax=Camellia lanceoleosa TaxID=1840588 RepID=A0ACC0FPF6_9ERIC|nr:hypothetical protein LOK49_LG13G02276 [Camellia lanceoleosa]
MLVQVVLEACKAFLVRLLLDNRTYHSMSYMGTYRFAFKVETTRTPAYCKIDGVQTDVLIKELLSNRAALLFGTFMEDETRSWLKQSYEKTENHVEKNEKHVEKKELEVGSSNVGTGLSFG